MIITTEEIEVLGIRRPFYFRRHSTDPRVMAQVFRDDSLDTIGLERRRDVENRYNAIVADHRRPLIIDAGANIGATSIWYALHYPRATVLAIEPDDGNFAVLSENAYGSPVKPVRGALVGDASRAVYLSDPGNGEWGYRTTTEKLGARPRVAAFDLDGLLASALQWVPFIFKCDIEGAEAELFAHLDPAVLWRFALLVVELHDWMLPGQATSAPFYRAVTHPVWPWDIVHRGEHTFCFNNRKDWPQ